MHPVLTYGSIELSSYLVMLSLGACVSVWLTNLEIGRKQLDAGAMLTLTGIAFASGVIGARGLSLLLHHDIYLGRPWWFVLAIWDQVGLSLYGGLGLAAALGMVYVWLKGLGAWDVADTLVVAWTPFIALTRIGCFLNGCCYGRPTTGPFGLVAGGAPNHVNFGIPSHPTQLYAAGAALGIFALLWRMRKRRRFVGQLTLTFVALYSAFTFFHEFLRGDPRIAWRFGDLGVLSLNQLISIVLFVFAIVAREVLVRRNETAAGDAI